MFADYREPLVEVAAQLLVVLLDHETMQQAAAAMNGTDAEHSFEVSYPQVHCMSKEFLFPTSACKGSLLTPVQCVFISYPQCAYR